jgi:hypothetical protein
LPPGFRDNLCKPCNSISRDCTDEQHSNTASRLNKLKCNDCRQRKQRVSRVPFHVVLYIQAVLQTGLNSDKCSFSDGPWPAKCQRCKSHGLECTESRETALLEASELQVNVTGRGHPSTPINGKLPDIPTQTLDDKRINMWQSLGNRAARPCNTSNIPRLPPFIFHIETCDTLQSRRRRGHPYCGRKKRNQEKRRTVLRRFELRP